MRTSSSPPLHVFMWNPFHSKPRRNIFCPNLKQTATDRFEDWAWRLHSENRFVWNSRTWWERMSKIYESSAVQLSPLLWKIVLNAWSSCDGWPVTEFTRVNFQLPWFRYHFKQISRLSWAVYCYVCCICICVCIFLNLYLCWHFLYFYLCLYVTISPVLTHAWQRWLDKSSCGSETKCFSSSSCLKMWQNKSFCFIIQRSCFLCVLLRCLGTGGRGTFANWNRRPATKFQVQTG